MWKIYYLDIVNNREFEWPQSRPESEPSAKHAPSVDKPERNC